MTAMYVHNVVVKIQLDGLVLPGHLTIPENAAGIVVFCHGSGSSRFSPRNNYVAETLHKEGMATLLFDLLTQEEDSVYQNRFDIDLLTLRLIDVTQWIKTDDRTKSLQIGYCGASTGSASALRAAAFYGNDVTAVVSRGGRPDLAMATLHKVTAPTLLLVGGLDIEVIELNELAYHQLNCEKKLEIITGATHLFREPGKLKEVAHHTTQWFSKWF